MLTIQTISKGAQLVVQDRNEQIDTYKFDQDHDKANDAGELVDAALFCIDPTDFDHKYPSWWENWFALAIETLPKKERYIKAAGLLIAEIDRLEYEEQLSNATNGDQL
jgi:hypothetical protein